MGSEFEEVKLIKGKKKEELEFLGEENEIVVTC